MWCLYVDQSARTSDDNVDTGDSDICRLSQKLESSRAAWKRRLLQVVPAESSCRVQAGHPALPENWFGANMTNHLFRIVISLLFEARLGLPDCKRSVTSRWASSTDPRASWAHTVVQEVRHSTSLPSFLAVCIISRQEEDCSVYTFVLTMARGKNVYLSYTALVLLSIATGASAIPPGLFDVDIWEGPAPPPAKGPPFSAHASRDRSLLPFQIIGVVGAYVGSILIIGTLLLTVGRKARKRAQTMAAQPKEMVKPLTKVMDPSPMSPGSNKSWYSPRRLRQKKSAASSVRSGTSNHMSPGMDSVVSFDNNVIEADRARRQEEMERLYAAVMAQDERSASQRNVAGHDGVSPPEYSGRYQPRLLTDDPALRHLHPGSSPASPGTPKSPVRAIYPPTGNIPGGPTSPTSPIKAEFPNYSLPQQGASDASLRGTREGRTPSFGSGQAPTSANSTNPKKIRKSLRNIKISSPLMKDDNSDGARTPLSPRFYTDPGIPPDPPTARTTDTFDSQDYPPTTPGTAQSYGFPEQEEMDEVRDLPQANPQRLSTHNYNNQAQMVTNAASTRPDPTKTANSAGTLPLREMNRQYAAQQQQAAHSAFPLSPGQWNNPNNPGTPGSAGFGYITSAGPVKTTFVDAQRRQLGTGMTPRTGQATPYSPYMPFTPLTPVTPRLTTRAERKQRQKEEKREQGVIMEEDAVVDEKELWSSGY